MTKDVIAYYVQRRTLIIHYFCDSLVIFHRVKITILIPTCRKKGNWINNEDNSGSSCVWFAAEYNTMFVQEVWITGLWTHIPRMILSHTEYRFPEFTVAPM